MDINRTFWQTLKATMAPLSPRHRQWKRFLNQFTLDPAKLAQPIASPSTRDFIICGSPRTGTTLLNAILFQPPAVITVMEPWAGMRLLPAELFASIREEVKTTGSLRQGKLNIEALLNEGAVRWCQEGEAVLPLKVDPGYLLGIKWPTFWQYLPLLPDTKFLVCIRHPFEVINSYKKTGGRVAQGLEYDTAFNRKLNQELQAVTQDVALRRILLYDYINSRLLPYLSRPNVFVVRYERWFTEPDQLLAEISDFLETPLQQGPVRIHPSPKNTLALKPDELTLIRQHSRTAIPLGYSLD